MNDKGISSIIGLTKSVSHNKMLSKNSNENVILEPTSDAAKSRKRKWISKNSTEAMLPILSISSDSLKNVVSDVKPVPLDDISLEAPIDLQIDINNEKIEKSLKPNNVAYETQYDNEKFIDKGIDAIMHSLRSPSPSKNEANNLLYITNLVRPFTVLQLKGLLARTGKINDNGFWIDRIKSKCYVEYETKDEAIETRHALHGVRWPPSNPKCLNVEFGRKDDYLKAILSVVDNNVCGQENSIENSSLYQKSKSIEKKIKPVREWDVGKNTNCNSVNGEVTQVHITEFQHAEMEDPDNVGKHDQRKFIHKKHLSENKQRNNDSDPPLRLLDDLFRKTQTTPSIYWLPLTPEQITDKYVISNSKNDEHSIENVEDRKSSQEGETTQKLDKISHRSRSLNKQRY